MSPLNAAWLLLACIPGNAFAASPGPPPAFLGGVPGVAQMRAVEVQRHQARTLLYRQALDELRRNPAVADVPECKEGSRDPGSTCLQGVKPAPESEPQTKPTRRIALLVGNSLYRDPIPQLDTPDADVTAIAGVLQSRYGFETRILKNGTKKQIVDEFNRIAGEATPDDSVVLFYAGHGYLLDDIKMGFWIPVDGSEKSAANWISNKDIAKLLHAIPARQMILVSDSCYSGTLTREQKVAASATISKEDILRKRSVLALSSGGDEPVADGGKNGHSIFAWHLINLLQGAQELLPGYEVHKSVQRGVTRDYPQTPQYGAVSSAGHVDGGEYLFEPRQSGK
jgi:uncharacterized caspase-like protein